MIPSAPQSLKFNNLQKAAGFRELEKIGDSNEDSWSAKIAKVSSGEAVGGRIGEDMP